MYFTYKDISSIEKGLRLIEFSPPSKAEEKTEHISIPGRAVSRTTHKREYKNSKKPLKFALFDRSNYRDILAWLDGTGKLVFSDEPNKLYTVHMSGEAVCTRISDDIIEVETEVTFEPFAYSANPTTAEIATVYTAVENIGTVFSEPIFEITLQKNDAPILMGDVNFDGKVTPTDASMVLEEYTRISTGQAPTFTDKQFAAADINGDGLITPSDAQAILDIATQSAIENPNTIAQNVVIDVNGEKLTVGIPNAVISNGFTVTVDCGLKLIYYTTADGSKVNILQYSYGDLPLLHTGINYIKYTGNNVDKLTVTVNERWR